MAVHITDRSVALVHFTLSGLAGCQDWRPSGGELCDAGHHAVCERRLLVMSATLGKELGERLAALLEDDEGAAAPLLVSAGRQFPVKTTFLGSPGLPGESCPRFWSLTMTLHESHRAFLLVLVMRICPRTAA